MDGLDIRDLIDIKALEKIQDKLAVITGMSFVTVDFKGDPITKYSNFSNFCSEIRRNKVLNSICRKSDAHAGLESVINNKPHIYKCPFGLVDCSAPKAAMK